MPRSGFVLPCLCSLVMAQHTQKAHDHSAAQLNIAVDGKTAAVDFDSPAITVIGFEHPARTADEKKKQEAAFDVFRKRFGTLVIFDPSLGCTFTVKKLELAKDSAEPAAPIKKANKAQPVQAEHSDVEAEIAVVCNKQLAGSKVRFGFTKTFPGIQALNVQALSGSGQSGALIRNDQGEITIGQ